MADQTPDPWKEVEAEIARCREVAASYNTTLDSVRVNLTASLLVRARDAERQQHQQTIQQQAAQIETLTQALERIRDCDWTIGRGDRMDPVRDIARQALAGASRPTEGEPFCRCPSGVCYLHTSLKTCGMRERPTEGEQ